MCLGQFWKDIHGSGTVDKYGENWGTKSQEGERNLLLTFFLLMKFKYFIMCIFIQE